MCGRFALSIKTKDIEKLVPSVKSANEIPQRYNIAPSQPIAAVLNSYPEEIIYLKWGLVPFWSKELPSSSIMINARAETLMEKPAFKHPFRKRRCLILASGFYEWKKTESNKKIPYFIKLKSNKPFTFAGIWDEWNGNDASALLTGAIITVTPNELMSEIHNRMPAIIPEEDRLQWLNNSAKEKDLLNLLKPYSSDLMIAYPVSLKVNNPMYDYEDCIFEVK